MICNVQTKKQQFCMFPLVCLGCPSSAEVPAIAFFTPTHHIFLLVCLAELKDSNSHLGAWNRHFD